MRVLHVYKDYYPVLGGIENHVRLLAEEQVKRGLDVTVLVTSLNGSTRVETMNGVRLIKAARWAKIASTPLSLDLLRWMSRLEADVTHLHFPYPPGELAHLLVGRGRRTVITYHSDVVRQRVLLFLYKPMLWRVLARADRILPTSPNYIDTSPFLRQVADKCEVVPLGIDLEPFRNVDENVVSQLRRESSQPRLLFVGLLRYYKGVQYLIEAMSQVGATLWVIGSGPMEAEWRGLAARRGVLDRVKFLGEVPNADLPAYYYACDLFVLPGSQRSEAFGAVQIEAMAAGKPVICTELGTGTSFVNLHGETGLVVPPRDSDALAQAINRLLADPALRAQMGQKAKTRAQEFSKERMVERISRVYDQVLNSAIVQ